MRVSPRGQLSEPAAVQVSRAGGRSTNAAQPTYRGITIKPCVRCIITGSAMSLPLTFRLEFKLTRRPTKEVPPPEDEPDEVRQCSLDPGAGGIAG